RRVPRGWVGVAALVAICLLIAQVVVFGRGAQGTKVAPFAAMRVLWGKVAGIGMPELATASLVPVAALAMVQLFCLACVWGGVAGLGWRRVVEPPVLLLVGIGAAGVGAAMVLGHPAESQLYFLEGARPYLSIAAVCGIAGRRVPWRWAGAGVLIDLAAAWAGVPGGGGPLAGVVVPYLVLGAGVAVAVWWGRGVVLAAVALGIGYAVPASAREVVVHVLPEREQRPRMIPDGALAAGRWLRRHSAPGDVVATDLHCRPVLEPACDSRHYWVAGFTERRVLVEGWAYAESTLARTRLFHGSYLEVPFADQRRLAANDAVFAAPTAGNVRRLADEYGVRWLFTRPDRRLEGYAVPRFRNAAFAVYEIPAG
ncbi:MAG TPA: hypothetical protein VFV66_03005, partial [Nonomuraea sp.]|nr:hypothetical protein [Nonomuraea sp.]